MAPTLNTDHMRQLAPPVPIGHPGVGNAPRTERRVLVALCIFFIAFGAVVLHRSAFSDRRRTDAGVFFRAGYAVRSGVDPYSISDDNGWYFLYPPAAAVAFVPLADPPAPQLPPTPARLGGAPQSRGCLPYPVSVVLWYIIGVGGTLASVHWAARAMEAGSPDPLIRAIGPRSAGWWAARLWPVLMLLPDIGSTLSRGQINSVLLALICASMTAIVWERRVAAGALLAAAGCVKLFPGLLVFYLLSKPDWRALRGYVVYAAVFLLVVPVVIYGPERAVDYSQTFVNRVILAGILGNGQRLAAGSGMDNTDNLAIMGTLHNLVNLGLPRGKRPAELESWIPPVHVAVSAAMLGITLVVGRSRRESTGLEIVLRLGMLCDLMILAVPMCHRHYYLFMLPTASAFVFAHIGSSPRAAIHGWGRVLIPAFPVLMLLPRFAQEGLLRDLPIPQASNLAAWTMSAVMLHRLAFARRDHAVEVENGSFSNTQDLVPK